MVDRGASNGPDRPHGNHSAGLGREGNDWSSPSQSLTLSRRHGEQKPKAKEKGGRERGWLSWSVVPRSRRRRKGKRAEGSEGRRKEANWCWWLFFLWRGSSLFAPLQCGGCCNGVEERGGRGVERGTRRGRVWDVGGMMHVVRRLKSIASGRPSTSEPDGDSGTKRSKVDQDKGGEILTDDDEFIELDQNLAFNINCDASSSHSDPPVRTQEAAIDQLHKEMHYTTIRDDKVDHHMARQHDGVTVTGNGTEPGQIVSIMVTGQNGESRQITSYMAERVIGSGSFGTVFQAKCVETGEAVAIKKVLQDKRYKNRELQIVQLLDHPNVVLLKHHFFSTNDKDELYLNLVLEYVPDTVYRVTRHYGRMSQRMPLILVQLYTYQICRALAYIHRVVGVCHRDIKPQNLLVNTHTHQVKLCDFGSAKKLLPEEPNISYICSRYYRAPELIFGATEYTTAIDMWSTGCVLAEFLIGKPLFPGESGVDQLVEIIKILGTPTREEIKCMNPNYTEFKFPQIKAHPWHKLFYKGLPPEGVDLVSRLLQYSPNLRCTALEACAHPFFDVLRDPNTRLPSGKPLPPLFNFTPQELEGASPELIQRLLPADTKKQMA